MYFVRQLAEQRHTAEVRRRDDALRTTLIHELRRTVARPRTTAELVRSVSGASVASEEDVKNVVNAMQLDGICYEDDKNVLCLL